MKDGKLNSFVGPDETMPSRHVQSKRFITTVMILCAVARPRVDQFGKVIFDGKIGFWGFTEEVEAQRSSKHRPRYTKELSPVNVDRDEYRKMLVGNLLPVINAKWPSRRSPVYVQQDGAPAHVKETDIEGYEFKLTLRKSSVILKN